GVIVAEGGLNRGDELLTPIAAGRQVRIVLDEIRREILADRRRIALVPDVLHEIPVELLVRFDIRRAGGREDERQRDDDERAHGSSSVYTSRYYALCGEGSSGRERRRRRRARVGLTDRPRSDRADGGCCGGRSRRRRRGRARASPSRPGA